MEFVDRFSAYPNRYLLTAEDGSTSHVILERADEPVTPGTPLNAETFNALVAEITNLVSQKADKNQPYWLGSQYNASTSTQYCKIAQININDAYMNEPIVFDIMGREFCGRIVVVFANAASASATNVRSVYFEGTGTPAIYVYEESDCCFGVYVGVTPYGWVSLVGCHYGKYSQTSGSISRVLIEYTIATTTLTSTTPGGTKAALTWGTSLPSTGTTGQHFTLIE